MAGPIHKIKGALSLLSHGYMGVILKEVGRELASDETCYAFRRNLSRPFDARPATIPIAIRPFEKRDIALLGLGYRDSAQAVIDRVRRTRMIEAGIASHIYVAVTSDGSPCFIQCMISPAHNSKLSAAGGGLRPRALPGSWDNEVRDVEGLRKGRGNGGALGDNLRRGIEPPVDSRLPGVRLPPLPQKAGHVAGAQA